MDDILDIEMQMELKALRDKIEALEAENDAMKKVIIENDLLEEVEASKYVSPEEKICLDGIKYLAERFANGTFDRNDTNNYDILHKNLRMIRGHDMSVKKKTGKFDPKEALRIVEGMKKKK